MGVLGSARSFEDEPWRRLVAGEIVEALDEDTGELIDVAPDQADPNDVEGILVRLLYRDASDNYSRRVVLCWRAWQANGTVYVQGYCTLREALRTFRSDRMSAVEEVRTRRAIDDPVSYFARFADNDDFAPPPMGRPSERGRLRAWRSADRHLRREAVERGRELCRDGLKVLAFVAFADGDKSEVEHAVMRDYVRARLEPLSLPAATEEEAEAELVDFGEALAPTRRSFTIAVNRVVRDEANVRSVFEHAVRLAQADGNSDPVEVEAVRAIVEALEKSRGIG